MKIIFMIMHYGSGKTIQYAFVFRLTTLWSPIDKQVVESIHNQQDQILDILLTSFDISHYTVGYICSNLKDKYPTCLRLYFMCEWIHLRPYTHTLIIQLLLARTHAYSTRTSGFLVLYQSWPRGLINLTQQSIVEHLLDTFLENYQSISIGGYL